MRITNNHKVLPRTRFILAFLATLALTVWAPDYSKYNADQKMSQIIFKAACRLTNYDCTNLHAPIIRRSRYIGDIKVRGLYAPSSVIFWLDNNLRGTQQWLTAFHETVHYLQWFNTASGTDTSSNMICLLEDEALKYVNQYVDILKAPQSYKRSLEEWRKLYSCAGATGFTIIGDIT